MPTKTCLRASTSPGSSARSRHATQTTWHSLGCVAPGRTVTPHPWGLVVFDLDGTLLRPSTACEIIAETLGRGDEMRAFEQLEARDDITRARETMAGWYRPIAV